MFSFTLGRKRQIVSTHKFISHRAYQSAGPPLQPRYFWFFLKPLYFMIKSGKKTLYKWWNKSVFLSRRNLFPHSNTMTKQQAPEQETRGWLLRMKHHHQDHLDPDCASFVIARLKFNKMIFGNSKGTEDNINYKSHKLLHRSFFLSITQSHRKPYLNWVTKCGFFPIEGYQLWWDVRHT